MELKTKKLQSPPDEEMELGQRTGRLSFFGLRGGGSRILTSSLAVCACSVKNEAWEEKAEGGLRIWDFSCGVPPCGRVPGLGLRI